MISEKKLEANRRNAQLSTGPRSEEGRKAVSLNSLIHGLRARHVVTLAEKSPEFYRHCAVLFEEWQPQTPTEQFLVEQMAITQWKLGRLDAVESSALLQSTQFCLAFRNFEEYKTEDGRINLPDVVGKREAEANRALDRYSQWITRLERSYYRALETLQHLQERRKKEERRLPGKNSVPVEIPMVAAAGAGVPPSLSCITKSQPPDAPTLKPTVTSSVTG
jgi:hypothetical protein